jgi:hypothetical protein
MVESDVGENISKEIIDGAEKRRSVIGYILERVTFIENAIGMLIEYYFFAESPAELGFEFDVFLWRKELTFDQKIRVLRRLAFEKRKELKFSKEIYKDIEWLQERRNGVAHGIKHKDEKENFFKIFYHGNKYIPINSSFVKEFTERANKVERALFTLMHNIERQKLKVNR